MRARIILAGLIAIIAFASCGTQKAAVSKPDEGPIIQTKFLGAEFGLSQSRTKIRWSRYRPLTNNDGTLVITDQSFGGYNWHYVLGYFVGDMLSIVGFQQEFNYEEDARDRFDAICRMLRVKYGKLEPTEKGDGFFFTDTQENTVSITVHPGTAKSGRDFWYCDLGYYWGPGAFLLQLKSFSEL